MSYSDNDDRQKTSFVPSADDAKSLIAIYDELKKTCACEYIV